MPNNPLSNITSFQPVGLDRPAANELPSWFDPSTTLIRMREVESMVGLARPTIYKLMNQPDSDFPQPVKLCKSDARSAPVAWVLSEVQAWVKARIAERESAA